MSAFAKFSQHQSANNPSNGLSQAESAVAVKARAGFNGGACFTGGLGHWLERQTVACALSLAQLLQVFSLASPIASPEVFFGIAVRVPCDMTDMTTPNKAKVESEEAKRKLASFFGECVITLEFCGLVLSLMGLSAQ